MNLAKLHKIGTKFLKWALKICKVFHYNSLFKLKFLWSWSERLQALNIALIIDYSIYFKIWKWCKIFHWWVSSIFKTKQYFTALFKKKNTSTEISKLSDLTDYNLIFKEAPCPTWDLNSRPGDQESHTTPLRPTEPARSPLIWFLMDIFSTVFHEW